MSRALLILGTGGFWAVMMAALVRREVVPYLEYQSPPSYRSVFRGRTQPELERRSVSLGTERVGVVETLFQPMPGGQFRLRTKVKVRMRHERLGEVPLSLRHDVEVDSAYQLARFRMEGGASALGSVPIRAEGRRRGDKLHVAFEAGFLKANREVDFPRDTTLADSFLLFHGGRLTVGKKWRLQTIELALTEAKLVYAYASVERREEIRWNGETVSALAVEVRKNASDQLPWHKLWVRDDGAVLVEQMSFGKLLYTMSLESKRALSADEIEAWEDSEPK